MITPLDFPTDNEDYDGALHDNLLPNEASLADIVATMSEDNPLLPLYKEFLEEGKSPLQGG